MDVVEYILDGLEAALELERELGVRTVECDRAVLAGAVGGSACPQAEQRARSGTDRDPSEARVILPSPSTPSPIARSQSSILDLCFLHDRPLSPGGVEMMAKIIVAMHRTAENAPIVVVPPAPQARVTVVLGGLALRKYFPGMRGEPGQWQKTPEGRDVLITYSPEYILRFGSVTPAVQKMKKDMWTSLKAVVQRCNQQ